MSNTNNKEVERFVETFRVKFEIHPADLLEIGNWWHQELQKARAGERERVVAKWNELYKNKAYSPGMITLEFSRFVKDITSNKTNGL